MHKRCLGVLYRVSYFFLLKIPKQPYTFLCFLGVGICIELLFLNFVFSYFIVCFCCLIINSENQKYGSFLSANLREMYFWGITSKCVFSLQLLKWWCWSSDWIEILPKNRELVFIQTLALILNVYISHSRIIVDFHFQLTLSEYRQCFYLFLLFLRACRRWKN